MLCVRPMPSRNEPCPCGSGQKYKRCCLGESRSAGWYGAPSTRRPPLPGLDPVTDEAAVLAEEVMALSNIMQRVSDQ